MERLLARRRMLIGMSIVHAALFTLYYGPVRPAKHGKHGDVQKESPIEPVSPPNGSLA